MGIKGLYGEIGEGERISLSKLSISNYEKTGRPLRVAIDAAIWQFQSQAGKGGSDPATRTLYYRLLRLLSFNIQPLFVFDGPNKPPFKRNKDTRSGNCLVSNIFTKKLLNFFGFPYHDAPGEAEAECALLQQNGIVDAILSEDIDTLMFGSSLILRNWSSEGVRGNKSPTHVSAYDSKEIKEKYSLDREGMILIALMSGGDYIPEGIPGCGIKLACEAAKAGFGKTLCKILRSDAAGYDLWKKNLSHEIATNKSKFFRVKRTKLKIPENFPNLEVLGFYTHPVVSSIGKIQKLQKEIQWDGKVDVIGLRQFVAEVFGWTHKPGAKKFIRGLAPALIVHKLRLRGEALDHKQNESTLNQVEIVRQICGFRSDFSTDGMPELRLEYCPLNIVGLDLDAEEDPENEYCRNGLAPRNDDDKAIELYASDTAIQTKKFPSPYDPAKLDKIWVARTIAKVGVPLRVKEYEEGGILISRKTLGKKINKKTGSTTKRKDKCLAESDGCVPQNRAGRTRPTTKNPLKAMTNEAATRSNNKVNSAHVARSLEEVESSPVFKAPTPIHGFANSPSSLEISDHTELQPMTPSLKCKKLRKRKEIDEIHSKMEDDSTILQINEHSNHSPADQECKQRTHSSSSIISRLGDLTLEKRRKYENESLNINSSIMISPPHISPSDADLEGQDSEDQDDSEVEFSLPSNFGKIPFRNHRKKKDDSVSTFTLPPDFGKIPFRKHTEKTDKSNPNSIYPPDFGQIPFRGHTRKIEELEPNSILPPNFGKIPYRNHTRKKDDSEPKSNFPPDFGKIPFGGCRGKTEESEPGSIFPPDFGKIPFRKHTEKKDKSNPNSIHSPDFGQIPFRGPTRKIEESEPNSNAPRDFGSIPFKNQTKNSNDSVRSSNLPPNFGKIPFRDGADKMKNSTHCRPKEQQKPSKFIILRDSLPGGWKTINENENQSPTQATGSGSLDKTRTREILKRDRKWRLSEIEVLDLSAS
ncbi:hypothetical protein K3495_g6082 [Podosphaera aphanis]|nr:hypothetical protein K3495_g6082 [Podosphaera aphanis]